MEISIRGSVFMEVSLEEVCPQKSPLDGLCPCKGYVHGSFVVLLSLDVLCTVSSFVNVFF